MNRVSPILSINRNAKAVAIPLFSTSFSTKCLPFGKTSISGTAELASFPLWSMIVEHLKFVCLILVVGGLNYAVHPQGNFPSILPQKLPTSSASVGVSSPAGMTTGPFHAPALDEASYKESGRVEPEKSAAPQSLEDKKREKMERNRESARKSRKRRKQYQQLLDSKVSEIIQELDTETRNRLDRIATSFREQVYACCYHHNMTVRFGNALNGRRTRRLAVCSRC